MAGAHKSFAALATVTFIGLTGAAFAQNAVTPLAPSSDVAGLAQVPKDFSPDCRIHLKAFEGKRPFKACRRALKERRTIKVLSLGASPGSSLASSPGATYAVRLENDLERFLRGIDVTVAARGVAGEVGVQASDKLRLAVADMRPDLVVWQVGTTDALARVNVMEFKENLRSNVRWLQNNKIDVVLIDPQYVERLAADQQYRMLVDAITKVAEEERTVIVHRFDAMHDLANQSSADGFLAVDNFSLNDLGYRCVAEYAARAIVSGILEAEASEAPAVSGQTGSGERSAGELKK